MSDAAPGIPSGEVDPPADALVACVRGAGFVGPVLVVARCDAVAREAPAWAAAFARGGVVYRVRVASALAPLPARAEIDDIAAEAGSLGATLVVVDGGQGAEALAMSLGAASGRPAAVWSGATGTLSVLPVVG